MEQGGCESDVDDPATREGGAPCRSFMRKRRPLLLGGERTAHVERLGKMPLPTVHSARWMVPNDLLEPAPDDFGEGHFVFIRQPFGLAIKRVWDLNLCFYHDGILPPVGESVNFAAELAQRLPGR